MHITGISTRTSHFQGPAPIADTESRPRARQVALPYVLRAYHVSVGYEACVPIYSCKCPTCTIGPAWLARRARRQQDGTAWLIRAWLVERTPVARLSILQKTLGRPAKAQTSQGLSTRSRPRRLLPPLVPTAKALPRLVLPGKNRGFQGTRLRLGLGDGAFSFCWQYQWLRCVGEVGCSTQHISTCLLTFFPTF